MADVPDRFFTEVTPLVYDVQWGRHPDVAFWTQWCGEAGGPVLELGCGSGRVTLPLARAGLKVVGIDLSEPMLRAARARLAAEAQEVQRRVQLVRGDMREPVEGKFGCAIIPAATFLVMLTREDQQRLVSAVHSALRVGGQLAFDMPAAGEGPLHTAAQLPAVRRASEDGTVDFLEERVVEHDLASQVGICTITYTFYQPAHLGRVTERVKGRLTSRREVEEVLRSSALDLAHVWGGYDRSPVGEESGRLVFVARKSR
jgi:SAM-dependent methyltransferase